MKRAFGLVLAVGAAALSACGSLSGLDATDSYGCKAPEGVSCMSVSGIYANSSSGGHLTRSQSAPDKSTPTIYGAASVAGMQPAAPGAAASNAIRSNPRLLRVWIAPWEDSDGDLHEEAYVHMVVDSGRWLVEHVRSAPRTNVDRAVPPIAPITPAADASASKASDELPPPPAFVGP